MSGPRLRIAIEPGADGLGIDAARDALFAWLLARSSGGALVLRSDLGTEPGGEVERICIDQLLWLGLGWDEGLEAQGRHGPYRRWQRSDIYRSTAETLLRRELAYRCRCPSTSGGDWQSTHRACACRDSTPSDGAARSPGAGQRIVFRSIAGVQTEDFVLLHRDGEPGPEFATAVDDAMMEISHVVTRPDRAIPATRQELLHDALRDGAQPQSIMLPHIDTTGAGATDRKECLPSIERLRILGYPPEAVLNLLAHLGSAPKASQELLTREEMLAGFDVSAAIGECRRYDPQFLDDISTRHMVRISPQRLAAMAAEHLGRGGVLGQPPSAAERDWAGAVARLYVGRLARMSDLPALAGPLLRFDPERSLEDVAVRRALRDPRSRRVLETVKELVSTQPDGTEITAVNFRTLVDSVRRATGAKGELLYEAIRISLTGLRDGPDLAQSVALIEQGSRLLLPQRVPDCLERATGLLAAIDRGAP